MFTLVSMILTATIVFIFRFINAPHKAPVLGVYQQANKFYWFKFVFMYLVLSFRQLYSYLKRRWAIERGLSDDGNIHVYNDEVPLEQPVYLGDHPLAVDAVYFNGTSKSGAALTLGVARRKNKACDAFLYLKVEGGDLLLSPKLPDSYLQQNENEDGTFNVGGIKVDNLVPMRSWTIQYTGEMKPRNNTEQKVQVEMNLTWSTGFPPFNYSKISPLTMAQDMAREPWSRDYFKMLKKHRREHYEQMGEINGTAIIDGKTHTLNMQCARDHSSSTHHDWRNFHRYVYHFIYLENGDCIAVGSASQPLILSHLTMGYFCRKSDQSVWSVSGSNFQLYQHGENQILPKDYGFSFTAGGKHYAVQVLVKDEEIFYIGKDREAKFYERWSTFQVNGVHGWGCVEWHYNNVQGDKLKK